MTAFGWGRQRTDRTPFEGCGRGLSGRRWIALCASAEAVGMTAAAVAAKLSQHVLGGQPRGWDAALALLLVVAGGLVEGVALGAFQASGLQRLIPRLAESTPMARSHGGGGGVGLGSSLGPWRVLRRQW